jgi:predicted DNA-binding protein with PD1-like motif
MKIERISLLSLLLIAFCAAARQSEPEPRFYAIRLQPGQDLRREIERFAKQENLQAGFIATCVGSLDRTALRLANQKDVTTFPGHMEIVSLVGTLSPDGVHLHLSVADKTGTMVGGHLVQGCRIYTTAELVIGEARELQFRRVIDPQTTYQELTVEARAN